MTSSIKLSVPKRRKRSRFTNDPTLPVPFETSSGEQSAIDNWNYYTGVIVDDHVEVQHSGDMDCLYRMGFFGKGSMSRNKPEYNREFWNFRRPRKEGDDHEKDVLRVVSKRRYIEHEAWKGGNPSRTSKGQQTVYKKRKMSNFAHGSHEPFPPPQETMDFTSHVCSSITRTGVSSLIVETKEPHSTQEKQEEEDTSHDWTEGLTKGGKTDIEVDPWTRSSKKDSEEFWGVPDDQGNKSYPKGIDPWGVSSKKNSVDTCSAPMGYAIGQSELSSIDNSRSDQNVNPTISPNVSDKSNCNHSNLEVQREDKDKELDKIVGNTSIIPQASPKKEGICGSSLLLKNETTVPVTIDPICLAEDPDGDLYVVDDSDNDETADVEKESEFKWLPTRKLDHYLLKESLHLTFEEAYFLSYGLGCLVVLNQNKRPVGLEEMWRIFCSKRENFLKNYIAYHSLRSCGWVPKTGLKYGTDFIVYHKGPPFYHGTYSVLVRSADQRDFRDDLDPCNRPLTWSSVMGIDRVTEQVAKEVLIMTVLRPLGLNEEELQCPSCIPKFKVQETLVRRWVPSKEREKNETEEWL